MSKKTYNKVVFLDIDGVLNYVRSRTKHGMYVLDKECTQRLKKVIEKYEAVIVLSSCWRRHKNWKENILNEFQEVGWNNPPIIDRTPSFWNSLEKRQELRGKEIEVWLGENDVLSYIIIDDDSDMLEYQKKFFIKTNFFNGGFKYEHAQLIDKIWGNPEK